MLKDELKKATAGFADYFENQRRNIGKSYQIANEMRELAKKGIVAVKNGDNQQLAKIQENLKTLWQELRELDIPKDMAWNFDSETGQEMVELVIVAVLYPLLRAESDVNESDVQIPLCDDLKVREQIWLAGFGDAVTELGKLNLELLCESSFSQTERLNLRKRFIQIAQTMRDTLGEFETAYPMVINNSRRRGFGNTYRGLLLRIDYMITREREAIAAILDRISV